MNKSFEEYRYCKILNKEVNVIGSWNIHESSTGPKPEIDKITLVRFNCDCMSVCGQKQPCLLRKELQAEKDIK